MFLNHTPTAALLALLCTAPGASWAVNYGFLEQAPLRFLSDADTALLGDTVITVLNESADGEERGWRSDASGNSGTVTAVRSFEKSGLQCRSIQIVTLARKAAKGRASSMMDLCKIEAEWRILRVPQ